MGSIPRLVHWVKGSGVGQSLAQELPYAMAVAIKTTIKTNIYSSNTDSAQYLDFHHPNIFYILLKFSPKYTIQIEIQVTSLYSAAMKCQVVGESVGECVLPS